MTVPKSRMCSVHIYNSTTTSRSLCALKPGLIGTLIVGTEFSQAAVTIEPTEWIHDGNPFRPRPLLRQRGARRAQRVLQALFGQIPNDRQHDPAQAGGNIARQRDGLAFQPRPAIPLLESPVAVQLPQEPFASARRHLALVRLAGVIHFGDPGGARHTAPAGLVEG